MIESMTLIISGSVSVQAPPPLYGKLNAPLLDRIVERAIHSVPRIAQSVMVATDLPDGASIVAGASGGQRALCLTGILCSDGHSSPRVRVTHPALVISS